MDNQADYSELIGLLQDRGHSAEEIDKIMSRVAEYEKATQHDSVMDSIGKGSLNLEHLIDEALGDQQQS